MGGRVRGVRDFAPPPIYSDLERVGQEVTVHVLPTGLPQTSAPRRGRISGTATPAEYTRRAELAYDATREYLEA